MQLYKRAFTGDDPFLADQQLRKSPAVEGFISGFKAALVGGPVAATYALLSGGKRPLLAGGLGALGAGAVVGGLAAAKQEIDNRVREAELRYHLNNMKDREPYGFLPPQPLLRRALLDQPDERGVRVY